MIVGHAFRQAEFRERVTRVILEILADLPETQRNIFIWNHYRGYQPEQIAEILGCRPSEIETALDTINSILCQRIDGLGVEDTKLDAEPGNAPLQRASRADLGTRVFASEAANSQTETANESCHDPPIDFRASPNDYST